MLTAEVVDAAVCRAISSSALKTTQTKVLVVAAGSPCPDGWTVIVRTPVNPTTAAVVVAKPGGDSTTPACDRGFPVIDPFMVPQPELLIGKVPRGTHNIVLNKFPITSGHVVLPTVEYRAQHEPLDESDFAALWSCLPIDGDNSGTSCGLLGFYNCGTLSGASQGHKHMQIIRGDTRMFIYQAASSVLSALPSISTALATIKIPCLPFPHALVDLRKYVSFEADPAIATCLKAVYDTALGELGIRLPGQTENTSENDISHNMLLTRQWMFVVPRKFESYLNIIPTNSLGFGGSFFVRNEEALRLLNEVGPINVLKYLAQGP
ncbi:5',5'''-P-1,P-4-tetraphosphate phosphorylase [Pelomyxa schiedti]|nr:5',5'''-P-1,P-4-tetraphosphate phosphorylase [Pelomyxa schiedti]